ncbi:hypothetical protein [Methanosphaerula palustris]|uniref:hypothetical protein n=1 Tax=Methanosphaerula palustris TaxID=475088 RepID=UPI00191C4DC2
MITIPAHKNKNTRYTSPKPPVPNPPVPAHKDRHPSPSTTRLTPHPTRRRGHRPPTRIRSLPCDERRGVAGPGSPRYIGLGRAGRDMLAFCGGG